MPVGQFSYQATLTGQQATGAIHSKTASAPPAQAGVIVWQTFLELLYQDITTSFATTWGSSLSSAIPIFPPASPSPSTFVPAPLQMNLISLSSSSGSKIDSQSKASTSSMPDPAAGDAATIIYSTALQTIYTDIVNMFSQAASTALNSSLITANPSAPAPSMLVAPTPISAKPPVAPPQISGPISSLIGLAQPSASEVKSLSQASTMGLSDPSQQSAIIYDTFIKIIQRDITSVITSAFPGIIATIAAASFILSPAVGAMIFDPKMSPMPLPAPIPAVIT